MNSLEDFLRIAIDEWNDTVGVCPTHGLTYTMDCPCWKCEDEFDSEIDEVFKEEEMQL